MKVKFNPKPYLFILPSFILIVLFFYYPVFYAISSSFTDLRLGVKASFVGLTNYIKLFHDVVFGKALLNQLILTLGDVFKNVFFPLLAAEMLYFIKGVRASNNIKRFFVLPMLVPGIVIILMWKIIFDQNIGILNNLLNVIGLQRFEHAWLYEEKTALWAILAIGFPFISGLYFLIFHAAVQSISSEVQEAATIDGCKSIQLVRYIHIPEVIPYAGVVIILSVLGSLQDYVRIMVTSGGGPGYATYIPALQMYKTAFDSQHMGYASAMGVVLFIIIICITLVSMKKTKQTN